MEDGPNLLCIGEEGYVKRAIGLKFFVFVGRVGVSTQDWCPRDQFQVNGAICQVNRPKGRVINCVRWVKYVSNDIEEGYTRYPTQARQGCPGFVEGLSGRGQVEGLSGIIRLLFAKALFVLKLLLGL